MNRRDDQPGPSRRWRLRPRRKPWKKLLLPRIESLEIRQLLSTVNWINPTAGNWNVAANWSTNTVPGPSDDAVINVNGVTVTIDSGNQAVKSLTANDPLSITGGALKVAGNSTISSGLAMTGGSLTASGSGTALTVTGTTTVSGASLFAQGGATLTLPALTSYSGGSDYTVTFQATGTGSLLSLPKLASISGEPTHYYSFTQVQALAGGNVQLPVLTQISGGTVLVQSDGTGSTLNVPKLASFAGLRGRWQFSTLQASKGGKILDGSLTTLSAVNLAYDSTATQATDQLASFTGGTFSIGGGTLSLPALTNADGSIVLF